MDHRQNQWKGIALTTTLVIDKAKSDSLENIKNLNLWGNDLEDLRLIREMPSLEVLSLSVNKISSLKDFRFCSKLRQLFLRKNNIHDIHQIRYLANLPQLTELWLHDNPCANVNNYRDIVIKTLPSLQKLDNIDITNDQRIKAQSVQFDIGPIHQHHQEDTRTSSNKKIEDQYSEHKRPSTGGKFTKSRQPAPRQQPARQLISSKQQSRKQWQEELSDQEQQNKHQPPRFQKQLPSFQQKPSSYPKIEQRQVTREHQKAPSSHNFSKDHQSVPQERNKHILLAVMSLLKQLDQQSLEIVGEEVNKLLG